MFKSSIDYFKKLVSTGCYCVSMLSCLYVLLWWCWRGEPTVLGFGAAENGVLCCKAIKPRDGRKGVVCL